jgi:hypothetical protein
VGTGLDGKTCPGPPFRGQWFDLIDLIDVSISGQEWKRDNRVLYQQSLPDSIDD